MGHTREIPRNQWGAFLSRLAERHPLVRVRVGGEELGDQRMSRSLPLQRFEVAEKGSGEGAIELDVGEPGGLHGHRIEHPTHVWVEETDEGHPHVIDIEDAEQRKTLVMLESYAQAFDTTDSPLASPF